MKKLRRVTRRNINKENMIALSYCQCQAVLNMFAYNCKIGYNAGVYGWNYDLYEIGDCSIVTGYNVPYRQCSDKVKKEKIIELENKIRNMGYSEIEEKRKKWEKEFLEIFE